MREYSLPIAAAHKIAVTATATSLKALIETANSAAIAFPNGINEVEIVCESGSDLRFCADGTTPTSTNGTLLKQTEKITITIQSLSLLKLIRTSSSDSVCSVRVGWTQPDNA